VSKNDPKFKAKKAEYHVLRSGRDPEFKSKVSSYQRKFKYGMTDESFEELLKLQDNRCAICRKVFNKTPHIDHCHTTNQNRGLLCGTCNRGLGMFFENTETLLSAISYLEKHKPKILEQ
jgi:hypothetical protein